MLSVHFDGHKCSENPGCVNFLYSTIRHGNAQMFGRNIDGSNVEIRVKMEHFLSMTFNYFYMGNESCMKLEDVLEIFQVLMLGKKNYLFLFGDLNNVHRLLDKLHLGPIII
jgi:hypothetical protein